MQRMLIPLVVAIVTLGASDVAAQSRTSAPSTGPAAELLRAERQLLDAMTSRDSSRLAALLAPQFGLVSAASTGEVIPRTDWLRGVLDRQSTDRGEIGNATVRVHARDVATLVATVVWRVQDPGAAPITERYVITDTWIRRGRAWQLAARHSSQRLAGP